MLALISALAYGVSDYLGGRTSRRHSPIAVAFFGELSLVVVLIVVVPLVEAGPPSTDAVGWGIAAGLSGVVGILAFYRALARGAMTIVAPVTGVVSAAVPVLVGFALGERPGAIAGVGMALGVLAVALIGGVVGATHDAPDRGTLGLAVLVGVAFGTMFVAFSRVDSGSGLWPLLTGRLVAVPILAVAYLWKRRSQQREISLRGLWMPCLAIAILVGAGNIAYIAASQRGLLVVVAVVVSMYPASTIACAAVLDGERVNRPQIAGMCIAVAALVAIAAGG